MKSCILHIHAYCRLHDSNMRVLQIQDFLTRVGSGRFPSIEKDMQMVQAHCGSLFLDPAQLAKVALLALPDKYLS